MYKQILIVDYSWSGTTAKLAAQLQKMVDAERIQISVPVNTFPTDMYATADVAKQQLASGKLPQLVNKWPDFNHFQLILVGGPVWGGQVATPVKAFLSLLTDFHGTVAPFYTDAGTPGGYEADFQNQLSTIKVVTGLGLTAGQLQATEQLSQWWQTLNSSQK